MCDMYKSFDFSELDNTSYFYGELVKYYDHEVDKSKFPSLESFLNFNKKLPGPIFKDEHNRHRITEFVGLRPKIYCLVDEKHVKHNAAKGVPRNVVMIDGERMSVKNIELYKRVFEAEKKGDAVIEGMDLGRQRAYTGVRSLPTVGHAVKKKSLFTLDNRGRKWISAHFTSWVARKTMAENGRKWPKKVHRGYLVGNGFRALYAPFPYYFGH